MARVPYQPVIHDGERTMEQQTYLLAKAARNAWRIWAGDTFENKQSMVGINKDLDVAMRELFTQLCQTDIFMGGVHHGRDEKK